MNKENRPDYKKGFPEGSSIEVFLSLYNPKIKKSSGRHYFPPRISMNLKKLN